MLGLGEHPQQREAQHWYGRDMLRLVPITSIIKYPFPSSSKVKSIWHYIIYTATPI